MGLSFTVAAGPRQHSHFQIWVPRDSWPFFTVSDSRLPKPEETGRRIYIPQEQGSPVITPGTGFPFRRLLRLAGLRWRYPTPPPHGIVSNSYLALLVTSRHGPRRIHRFHYCGILLLPWKQPVCGALLRNGYFIVACFVYRWLATGQHATILT
jgi:hypothetical protein